MERDRARRQRSDVDLVRFTTASVPSLPDSGSHLVAGRLVVVSDAPPDEVETWFVQTELAVSRIPGLRQGRPLRDRGGYFAAHEVRAQAFVWDAAVQARADAFANQAMVGWVEEVHNGPARLRSGDVGRLLDAESVPSPLGCGPRPTRLAAAGFGCL
ncbi:MAG: hypothetical protein HY332_08645 [Chloroflexi bacterium]|nr:hypothetical protein [Chloroflexota bacterium]